MTDQAPAQGERPTLPRAVARGLVMRCARCGGRKLFRRWLAMAPACPTCGLHFERQEGYWLGSMALNLVVTELIFVVVLVGLIAATWPDVQWTLILVVLVATNLVVPLLFHPASRTIWVALERSFSSAWD